MCVCFFLLERQLGQQQLSLGKPPLKVKLGSFQSAGVAEVITHHARRHQITFLLLL